MMIVVMVPVAGARVAATAMAVAGAFSDPMTDRMAVAVIPMDVINRIDRGAAGMVADDAAIHVAVVSCARLCGGDKTNTGSDSEKGDDLFHEAELGFAAFDESPLGLFRL